MKALLTLGSIERRIYLIRGHKVMLDRDLAELYGVTTFNLNKAVKRNWERFPSDFMFRLSNEQWRNLIFQIGISSSAGWGGRRHLPYAFTEQGVAMLSGVLGSPRAVQVHIAVMRAFVKLREMIASHRNLARKLAELEKKYDARFRAVFDAIRELMAPREKPKRQIGFVTHSR